MSEKSSEYLKRTCLICGCHTDQTINIYEPRSGPNIVELIQAKFKIQPLNEEKYLCFSCNNWLINWHSLQSLNSNDAESPSGTSRKQTNGMLCKENAENQRQQTQILVCRQKNLQHYRPTAKVRPWCIKTKTHSSIPAATDVLKEDIIFLGKRKKIPKLKRKFRNQPFYYGKRRIILRNNRLKGKFLTYKPNVGYIYIPSIKLRKPIALWLLRNLPNLRGKEKTKILNADRSKYNHDEYDGRPKKKGMWQKNISEEYTRTIVSNNDVISKFEEHAKSINTSKQCLKRPLVDGKVVSMLRRLGTTLSHGNLNEETVTATQLFPRMMSPTKSKPLWSRQLDENEILLDFNSAISEVLPQVIRKQNQTVLYDQNCAPEVIAALQANRKLTYQVSIDKDNSQYVYPLLPQGLSISLI